jgi:hypothetical protein
MLEAEIAKYLEAQKIGNYDETGVSSDPWSIFIASLPSSPDECIAIYPTGGDDADTKLGYDNPRVQFIVRGTLDPRPALQKARDIYNTLQGFHMKSFISGGVFVLHCQGVQSGPVHIGRDENNRHELSLNFDLEIRNKSMHRE